MNHLRPDFQSHADIGCTRDSREASSIVKQRLGLSPLELLLEENLEIRVKRRNTRVLPIHSRWQISVSQFNEILLVNERIDGIPA